MPQIFVIFFLTSLTCAAADATLKNSNLLVRVTESDGSYSVGLNSTSPAIFHAKEAAQVNHHWIKSTDYPQHQITESTFEDVLGQGHQVTLISTGLPDSPTLVYTIRTYDTRPFGDIQVVVQNRTGKSLSVESIRCVEAAGEKVLNLQGQESSNRVLSPQPLLGTKSAPHSLRQLSGISR